MTHLTNKAKAKSSTSGVDPASASIITMAKVENLLKLFLSYQTKIKDLFSVTVSHGFSSSRRKACTWEAY